MDAKLQVFLDKVREMANRTGKAAGRAADAAGKKAGELATSTKLNLQIFDLNTECDLLYKELGKMVYEIHRGVAIGEEEMDAKIAQLDEKQEKIAALREELGGMKTIVTCAACGRQCNREDAFCAACGAPLSAE